MDSACLSVVGVFVPPPGTALGPCGRAHGPALSSVTCQTRRLHHVADGRWWRSGAVSGATRALRCLWHE
eukprot:5205706-Prymnesium_polylepis.1